MSQSKCRLIIHIPKEDNPITGEKESDIEFGDCAKLNSENKCKYFVKKLFAPALYKVLCIHCKLFF